MSEDEICKCGKPMKFHKEYEDKYGDYMNYEYICKDPDCDKLKRIVVCQQCEHEFEEWEE